MGLGSIKWKHNRTAQKAISKKGPESGVIIVSSSQKFYYRFTIGEFHHGQSLSSTRADHHLSLYCKLSPLSLSQLGLGFLLLHSPSLALFQSM